MADDKSPMQPPNKPAKSRVDRLAEALRDNLKRRKARDRALSSPATAGEEKPKKPSR